MSFKTLIDSWSGETEPEKTDEAYAVHVTLEDAARIQALVDLFPGVTRDRVITDLIAAALDELQAAIPYEQGKEVVREDDYGDPVYNDAGLTPRFLELVQSHKAALKS